ncbi:Glyoxalase/Bleomycin resistance protein/Dihydroxybiphenyl dioxygenase [Chytriomyces sp. MP71]|nr:Glyoxalase/Bleomycin resistance protein/Dihydroxybiphenyl dioxygenase [Chytriomyces sp. MP71]
MSSMTAKFSGLTHGNTAMGAGSEPKVSDKEPIANVEKYLSLGVAVADIPESVAFYAKLGFEHKYTDGAMTLLKHVGGFEIHLLKADKPHKDNLNILMDYPKNKFPGINHMSFSVPSVAACRDYLISQGIPIKDTRQYPNDPRIYALFIRDPSATTIEFENNSGEDTQFEGPFSSKHIGEIRPIDHVGIRVADPDDLELWQTQTRSSVAAPSSSDHRLALIST